MDRLPQIVKARLASRRAGVQAHPDANLLAAFGESVLPAGERQMVLDHLASCGECRDVVALALPEHEALQPRLEIETAVGWRFVRWAAVAACLAVVGFGGFWQVHRRSEAANAKLEQPAAMLRDQTAAIADNGSAAAGAVVTPPQVDNLPAKKFEAKKIPVTPRENLIAPSSLPMPSAVKKQNDLDASMQRPAPESPRPPSDQPGRILRLDRAKPAPAPSTTVEMSAADTTTVTVAAAAPAAVSGVAADELSAVPRWQITANGSLQKSLDNGGTWQNVTILPDATIGGNRLAKALPGPPVPKPYFSPEIRALYTSGPEVWAGGAGGALFHSMNSGVRWVRVVPASRAGSLTGDIVRISFDDSLHGMVATSTQEVWNTSDGGQSWQRQ